MQNITIKLYIDTISIPLYQACNKTCWFASKDPLGTCNVFA